MTQPGELARHNEGMVHYETVPRRSRRPSSHICEHMARACMLAPGDWSFFCWVPMHRFAEHRIWVFQFACVCVCAIIVVLRSSLIVAWFILSWQFEIHVWLARSARSPVG